MSYQAAIFMPRSWSVTAGPVLDSSTVTELCMKTVVVCVTAVPVAGVTVRV